MIFFPWTLECSVGVASFDNEHWQLMKLVNELYDNMLAGKARERVIDIIESVLAYSDLHLKHEEETMAWAQYPDAPGHLARHDEFRRAVRDFQARARETEGTLAMIDVTRELAVFLKGWLEKHIFDEDRRLGQFLNAKGVH